MIRPSSSQTSLNKKSGFTVSTKCEAQTNSLGFFEGTNSRTNPESIFLNTFQSKTLRLGEIKTVIVSLLRYLTKESKWKSYWSKGPKS